MSAREDAVDRALVEQALGRPVARIDGARWGFTNTTRMITLADGTSVVLQRYGTGEDAEQRIRVMRALRDRAAQLGLEIPRVLAVELEGASRWAILERLPGVPLVEAEDVGLEGPRFAIMAREMGALLARLQRLDVSDLELDSTWADPRRLAEAAARWGERLPRLGARERASLGTLVRDMPQLFASRPAVLTHGDFVPINVLTDGASITGLLDFEFTRLADSLFDPAWWAWAVHFGPPGALDEAWPAFLEGAGLDRGDALFDRRIHTLQVLRMCELLGTDRLAPDVRGIVAGRLREML